jgi:beta-lactamase class A
VVRRARAGQFSLDDQAELTVSDLTGGSGVLSVLRPGLRCTVFDLCTLMIVVSDNTATNMLIDLCGGAEAVNDDFAALGFPGFRLNRPISVPPPPLTRDDGESGERPGTTGPGQATPVPVRDNWLPPEAAMPGGPGPRRR